MLMEKAFKWATAIWEKGGKPTASYECFVELFHGVFNHHPEDVEMGNQLLTIKQRNRQAAEYTLEFCTIAARSGWNKPALKATFWQGLGQVLTELACQNE